jgi:hypothetical protein
MAAVQRLPSNIAVANGYAVKAARRAARHAVVDVSDMISSHARVDFCAFTRRRLPGARAHRLRLVQRSGRTAISDPQGGQALRSDYGGRTARPCARADEERNQPRCRERPDQARQHCPAQLRRQRRRTIHIDRAGNTEEAMDASGRILRGRARRRRRIAAMRTEHKSGRCSIVERAKRRLAGCGGIKEALQDKCIKDGAREHASPAFMQEPSHDAAHPPDTQC